MKTLLPTAPAFDGLLVTDPVELLTYQTDAGLEQGLPDGVAFPRSAAGVGQIVAWAAAHGVPIIPRGAGTGTSGGAVAEHGGLILAFSRLDHLLEIDETGRSVTVEPGLVNQALDEALRGRGYFYPPDPASNRVCTLGGNVAENAGGPRCFKYGVTTNYVLGLKALLADGRIVQFGGNVAGCPEYDWTGLLTGSEGTLAITLAAQLRILRRPLGSSLLMGAFETVEQAGEAVSDIIAHGLVPATIEMMDQVIVRMIEEYSPLGLPVDAGAVLIVEADGYPEGLSAQLDEIAGLLRSHAVRNLSLARSAEERERIWSARRGSAGALARLAPAYYPSDCTVPRSKIALALHEINRICAASGLSVCYLLHAGDGNLHPHILIDDPGDTALMARVLDAEAQSLEICVANGGSITGEHGVGCERRHFMPLMYGAAELSAMQDLKAVFDPGGLLNPGKIFPAELPWAAALPAAVCPPGALFAPTSAEEAAAALRGWATRHPPATIRICGGGTKSALLPATDVVLSTAGLSGIRAYAPEDLYVTVGAGTPLAGLQASLRGDRLWAPLVSPWPEATVGGIFSSGFDAPLRMRYGYGGVRDLVMAATVALPDGRVIRAGRPVVKNVAGYDLPRLFAAAHGTLGLVTELTLRLAPWPRARASLLAPLDDWHQALGWGRRLLGLCFVASALLLCEGRAVPGVSAPYALVYTAEGSGEDVAAELAQARSLLADAGAAGVVEACQLAGSDLWAAFLARAYPAGLTLRLGVPPARLFDLLDGPLSATKDEPFVADLAGGLLYWQPRAGLEGLPAWRAPAAASGGYVAVLSAPRAEAGRAAGSPAAAVDLWGHRPDSLDLMRRLKARWDPGGVVNPGAFVV